MPDTDTATPATTDAAQIERMNALFAQQRAAFAAAGAPSRTHREENLDKLLAMVRRYDPDLRAAVSADFGNRSVHETAVGETSMAVSTIKYNRKKVGRWMRPRRRPTALEYQPGKSVVYYQPLGVVGIIAPWNYPWQLALSPLAGALAAGNRVLIKPSELTPAVADLMHQAISETFPEEEVAVVTGGPDVGAAFSAIPFDHLLYTGSTRVGRYVMKAAAENLTPVTLELGGKSPAIVGDDYSLEKAVASIAQGKLFNAGQTCIAPDYAFVPEAQVDRFVDLYLAQAEKMYPTLADNADYTSIVSDGHYDRIMGLVEDARQRDARVREYTQSGEPLAARRKIPPTVVLDVTDEMEIMQEEIFGPVLPVLPYKSVEDVQRYVNDRPRPLALYYFGNDREAQRRVMEGTISGGACVNDTVFHFAQEELGFGGVGPSGIGKYHGEDGFKTFSHAKGVFYQSAINGSALLRPPYGKVVEFMTKFLIGK